MIRQNIAQGFFFFALFLLPWQTIFLYRTFALPEGPTVYGQMGLYLTEVFIAFAFFLRGRPLIATMSTKVMRSIYFFLAACFLSLGWSHYFSVSAGTLSHVTVTCMLCLFLLDERTSFSQAIHVFLFGLIGPCVLGWYQYVSGWSPSVTWLGLSEMHVETSGIAVVATNAFRSLRAYGSFPHPNIFGGYLVTAILFIGWCVRITNTKKESYRYIPLIVLFASTLIFTFSRGAWLALTVSLFFILAQAFWYKKLIPHRAIPLLCIGLVTILLTVGVLYSHVLARFNPGLRIEAISLEERASQYGTFPGVFRINPLLGVGEGTYVFALEALSKGQPAWSYQPIHNAFFLMIAEIGILGFVAFGFLVFVIGQLILKHRKRTSGIFAISFLCALFILACFDHYLFSLWPGLVLSAVVFGSILRFMETEKTA